MVTIELSMLKLNELPQAKEVTIFDASERLNINPIVECIHQRGFCIIRGLFSEKKLNSVLTLAKKYFSTPAIAGAPGYWKVDHPKKLIHPFTLGGEALDLVLDERVIDIVEALMGEECILAETMLKFDKKSRYAYFPLHSDFAVGWSKSGDHQSTLDIKALKKVVGIGGALYLHDTVEGAFRYCDSTHHILSPRGQKFHSYPKEEQDAMLARSVCCEGLRGDLVLFDDRGFHGPSQPAQENRTVILLDYFNVNILGRTQVAPMPIWSTDIASLTDKQLRVAGVGANFMVSPMNYAHTRFQHNKLHKPLAWVIDHAYITQHFKNLVKHFLKRT